MSAVEILTTQSPVSFDSKFALSPRSTVLLSSSFHDTPSTNDVLVGSIAPSSATVGDIAVDFALPGLPVVHHGHPEVHLRSGVMRATEMATDGELDAEKAFFVADLSYVYRQHLRWKTFLPGVEPFYGKLCSQNTSLTGYTLMHIFSCQMQSRPLRSSPVGGAWNGI
jgi:ornithine decarboxylase